MFCQHCGKEIDESAYVCPNCGCKVKEEPVEEVQKQNNVPTTKSGPDGLSIASMVCAVLLGLVGLILSIISLNNHKDDPATDPSKKLAKIALIVSIVVMVLSIIISIIYNVTAVSRANSALEDMLQQLG